MNRQEIQPPQEKSATACGEQLSDRPMFTPLVDIFESEDRIVLILDMPGVGAKGVDIRIIDDTLYIKGCGDKQTSSNFIFSEYSTGDFFRTFSLSHLIDTSRVEARMKNGVLRVILPKSKSPDPKRIRIQTD